MNKSYVQRYGISLTDNAARLKTIGIKQYLLEERTKWTCP